MIISIIPARGNSKRIPRKNLRDWPIKPDGWDEDNPNKVFMSMPLIFHTITASILSGVVDLTIVSTEDDEIAERSRAYGYLLTGEENRTKFMVMKRPDHLSQDTVQTAEVVNDVYRRLSMTTIQEIRNDLVVVLQPTSPKRTAKHVLKAVQQFQQAIKSDIYLGSMFSAYRMSLPSHFLWKISADGTTNPMAHNPLERAGTQVLGNPIAWVENGAIYITTSHNLSQYGNYRAGRSIIYEMSKADSLDIDWPSDLSK